MRQLEREIGGVARKVARQVAEGQAKRKVTITEPRVRELLGKRKFFSEARRRTSRPGVATGLAWTPVGGEVLFIEATAMPGKGRLTITGQLGDVMKESAQAALSYVRSNAGELFPELAEDWFATHDIHIHVPAGAIPKDGPSAGITMATALASLLSGRPVRSDVAMTGRDHAHRPGAADRRPEGEGAGGAAQRDPLRDRAGAQRAGHRRDPRAPAQGPRVRVRVGDRRGARGGAQRAAPPGAARRSAGVVATTAGPWQPATWAPLHCVS